MSIANEITRLQTAKDNLKTSINAKGGTLTTETIDEYYLAVDEIETGGGPTIDEWTPNPNWPDLKTIIDNDTESYIGKVAVLYASGFESFDFNLAGMQAQAVKTSDGSFYTTNTLHTWDPLQDIDEGNGLKVRWVIWYYSNATSSSITSNTEIFKHKPKWIVVGSDGTGFNWKFSHTFYKSNYNGYLEAIENYNGGAWDTSSVTNMLSMFNGCSSLQTIPLIDTSSVTNMQYMFYICSSLQTIPLIDTSSVTSMRYMFNGCSSLQTIPQLDTSSVTDMYSMFNGCSSLQTIPLIDTSSVTDMQRMFYNCSSLQTIPLIDTSSVTDMTYIFNSCSSLQTIPQLDTSSVTIMQYMFNGCSSLQTIPLIDTSSVTNMPYMFDNCSLLRKVSIDTSSVTDMDDLFDGCYLLEDIGEINLSSVTPSTGIDADTFDFGKFSDIGYEAKATFTTNTINVAFSISTPSLTYDSLISLIGGLVDRSATTSLNVVLGATNIAKLTQTDLDAITAKNWTYS